MRPWAAFLRSAVCALSLLGASASGRAEERIALIITNSSYPDQIGRLDNTAKDGDVMRAALEAVDFRVLPVVQNANQQAMRQALADFVQAIETAGPDAVAFLYYSGHGAADRSDRGENYLIPTEAPISTARQLPIMALSLSEVVRAVESVPAKARFVVIDACRNVAFNKGVKGSQRGFVEVSKPKGIIIGFATKPGEVAEDTNVYSRELAVALRQPGLDATAVFKETQLKVADATDGRQVPWIEDGLLTRFKFVDGSQERPPTRHYLQRRLRPIRCRSLVRRAIQIQMIS